MGVKHTWHELRCFGLATVGPRGQVVIPASARKELGIDTGTRLLAFIGPGRRGLVLLKADAVEEMVNMLNQQLGGMEKVLKDYISSETAKEE